MQGLPVLELQMTGESSIGKTNIGKSHAIKYLWEKELIDKGLKEKNVIDKISYRIYTFSMRYDAIRILKRQRLCSFHHPI